MDKQLTKKISNFIGSALAVYTHEYRKMPASFSTDIINQTTLRIVEALKDAGYHKH